MNIIETAVTYFKRRLKTDSIKTCFKFNDVNVFEAEAKSVRSMYTIRTLDPGAWTLLRLGISDPPKSTSLFRSL